jgi:V/A-type H+-transporting ATPase subunit C
LHVKDGQQLETVLNQELLKLKSLIAELLLDKELLRLLELNTLQCVEDILKSYPSEFLEDYFRCLIDMHNIKSFLRLYFLKEPEEKLKHCLTCAGYIKKEAFIELYNQDLSVFLNQLEYVHKPDATIVDYSAFLKEAIQKIEKENSFVSLEKAINDFLIKVLKSAKYLSFGPEPLLAYYFAKVNEINLMRMIILAKFNDVSSDLVQERLNGVYA